MRREFELTPDYIHLALFFLASHPRALRQAIEEYRAKIDANPFVSVDSALFEPTTRTFRCRFVVPSPVILVATHRTSRLLKTRQLAWRCCTTDSPYAKATRS